MNNLQARNRGNLGGLERLIFGGEGNESHEMVKQKRALAQQLAQRASQAPRNIGEGLSAIGQALAARRIGNRADEIDNRLKSEFDTKFAQAAPNVQGIVDLAESPYAGQAHKSVLQSLLAGAPNYRRGTRNHPGGTAVVGENGPEVVTLPKGSQVDPMTGMQREINDLSPEQLQRFNERLQGGMSNSEALYPDGYDPRSMIGDQSRFLDDKAVQVADLDAFKLMEMEMDYAPPIEADINTTEGQRLALLRRMKFADMALEDPRLLQALTKPGNVIAGKLGGLGRAITGDEYEVGRIMAEAFADAALRNDTGAQAPDTEVQRAARQYAPQSFEGDAQMNAKRALRREIMRSLEQALGGDASPAVQQMVAEMAELRALADVPDGSLTGAAPISAEDEEFLKSLGIE